ncbi:hypothetical protein EGX78_01505 [Streptococcus pyogenes]|nr:hypothetical protein EGX78_01505 [Streptococcus pyogenes]QBC34304.1 hypothetical protein D0Z58_01365 [Streptococcus pyogenes]
MLAKIGKLTQKLQFLGNFIFVADICSLNSINKIRRRIERKVKIGNLTKKPLFLGKFIFFTQRLA